jgi:molybdopterin converting factor subunit 1
MQVRVRVFAAFREILGKDLVELDLPSGATARHAFETLFGARPDFDRLLKSTMFAVNQEYVGAEHPLRAGDELVFVPPIAGGHA